MNECHRRLQQVRKDPYRDEFYTPRTALEKLDCEQVTVIGLANHGHFEVRDGIALLPPPVVDGKIVFKKLVIRLKK